MRQFILGKTAVTSGAVTAASAGAVGLAYIPQTSADGLKGGQMTFGTLKDVAENGGEGNVVLVRAAADGGNVVIPFHVNHFSWVKGSYQAATTFTAKVTVPEPESDTFDFTIIAVKKGVRFNERNKWTATEHVKSTDDAAALAARLAKYFNNNSYALGLTAAVDGAKITFTAIDAGDDYEIVCADDLTGTEVTDITRGKAAYGDAKYITDLANKAAADAGFEYTYEEDVKLLYPKYPLDPLAEDPSKDTGFVIYTLRSAEPRDVKTRDEVVHQIIQIAVPTGVSLDALFATA